MCTPPNLVAKKLPGRTLPTEMRRISDVRLVNNFRDKSDYPFCANPSLSDIARRVGFLDRKFPGVARLFTKRDVGDAFKGVAANPDCASILCAEFPGADIGLPRDIVILWLALPFGRSASPGYFQLCARLVTKLHCAYQPVSPLGGSIPFSSHMFAGDARIVDVDFPQRLGQTANAWSIVVPLFSEAARPARRRRN